VGDYGYGIALGIILLILAFLVNVPLVRLQRRHSPQEHVENRRSIRGSKKKHSNQVNHAPKDMERYDN